MPRTDIDGVAKLALRAVNSKGKALVNVFHARVVAGTIDNGQLADAAQAIVDAVGGSLDAFGNYVTFLDVTATDLTTGSVLQQVIPFGVTNTGSDSGQEMPNATAMVFTLNSGFTGRSRRGRVYSFGTTENFNTAGKPTSDYITKYSAFLDSVSTALGLVGWIWCVASNVDAASYDVVSVTPRPIWRNQRRRQDDVGI